MRNVQPSNVQHSTFLDVGGVRVFCRYNDGDGPAVVLLQGGMLDSSTLTWRHTLEALPARYRVFAPDLPGYGLSEKPAAPYATTYYVDFLERLLDVLELPQAHVFGSSMSGAVALGLALRRPQRVASLVLSGAYGWQPRLPLHEAAYVLARVPGLPALVRRVLRQGHGVMRLALRTAVADPARITEDLVEDAAEGIAREGQLQAFFVWLRSELFPHHLRTNFAADLHRITQPTLILHGGYDWLMPPRYARRAAARLPNAHLHLFPDAGHLVPRERPTAVNRLVIDFLERLDGRD